jgi:hypothetical protein
LEARNKEKKKCKNDENDKNLGLNLLLSPGPGIRGSSFRTSNDILRPVLGRGLTSRTASRTRSRVLGVPVLR